MHWRDPFRVRSFRFQWPADLATSWAFEMESIVLGWFILVESGSVMMLVVFGSLQYLGSLVSPMFGVVGDRLGYRRMLVLSRALYAALAATFMLLAWLQALTPMIVLFMAALAGLVRPSDMMMRNALIAQTMPPRHLLGTLGISRITSAKTATTHRRGLPPAMVKPAAKPPATEFDAPARVCRLRQAQGKHPPRPTPS